MSAPANSNSDSNYVCAFVGEEAAEVASVALSLTERRAVDSKTATFKSATITTELPSGSVTCTYQLCDSVDALVDLNPNVVVMCYTPLDPPTLDEILDVWARALDRMYPRPAAIVAGTRIDLLANRKVLTRLHERKIVPIQVDEACDALSRLRLSSYNEVSASSYTGVSTLEQSVAKALVGEADKRMTPELVSSMRAACIAAGTKKSATWAARRDGSGRLFYFNRTNRKAQWQRPAEYDGEEPELTAEEKRLKEQEMIEHEEAKKKQERDREVAQNYLKDMAQYEERLADLEKREDSLKLATTGCQLELEQIRSQIEQNLVERQALERQKEDFLNNQKDFQKYSVEEDLRIEKELQAAKAKAFELEAMNALREERDFDIEIAESVLRNRSLATAMREVLQEQLAVQKAGATSQARTTAANKKLEESSKLLAQLRSKSLDLAKEKRDLERAIEPLVAQQAKVEQEVRELFETASGAQYAAIDRHQREKKLLQMCDELDERINALQLNSAKATSTGPLSRGVMSLRTELDRLKAEQEAA